MNRQHIIKAKYPNGSTAYLFYDIDSRLYSGHFFEKPIKKHSTLQTISDTFPPTFDEVGDFKLSLHKRGIEVDFLYLQPDAEPHTKYSFFETLKTL